MATTLTRGERTRVGVVEAARSRFAAQGFDGATVASIAADAGVSEPTVAFHFGSKAGLLVAVIEDHYDRLVADLDSAVDVEAAPGDRLRSFARWWVAHLAEYHDLLQVFGRQGRRTEVDEVVEAFVAGNRRVTRAFDRLLVDLRHQGVVREGVRLRIVRDAFFGAAEHLLWGSALTGRAVDLDRAADDLVELLLLGAGAGGPAHSGGGDDLARVEAKVDEVLRRLPSAD